MNININDIKNGMTIIMDGKLCQIVEFQHVKPGKGAAFVKMKLRNLKTGSIVEDTYNTNIKVEKAHIDRKPMQYLYSTGDNYVFMDTASYEQIEVPASKLEEEKKYLKENLVRYLSSKVKCLALFIMFVINSTSEAVSVSVVLVSIFEKIEL